MMHVRAFSFLSLCARNSLTFAALRSGDGLGPRCQYYRSPSQTYFNLFPVYGGMQRYTENTKKGVTDYP